MGEVMAMARQLWGSGIESTSTNLAAAAVGLASQWYRNTDAVEEHAHASGPWSDTDMLRHNARGTAMCEDALAEVSEAPEDALRILEELIEDLAAMLPTQESRQALLEEKGAGPEVAVGWVEANGFGNWLAYLTAGPFYPAHWWGAPEFGQIVEQYCNLEPGPPDLATFRDRMLTAPWTLSDPQAQFVCDHRYEVH